MLRPLSADEQQAVQAGLRSSPSFTVRRGQILLSSQRGHHARQMADPLRGGDQTVRHVLPALNRCGLTRLQPPSEAPRHQPRAVFDASRREP